MTKLKGLGKGLDALLAASNVNLTNKDTSSVSDKKHAEVNQLYQLSISRI